MENVSRHQADERKKLPLDIFDFHAHLPPEMPRYRWSWEAWFATEFGESKRKLLEEKRNQARRAFLLRKGFPLPDETQPSPEEAARRYAQAVEDYGLAGICFVTGGGNDVLAKAIQEHTKLYGFAHHDPFDPNAHDELIRAIEILGLRGYKILATALRRPLTSRKLYPLWEVCAARQVPVLIHFGVLGAGGGIAFGPNVNPLVLHDVAKGFPEVIFVIPHFGVGYLRELMQLMWTCENILVDTSGSNQWRFYTWPQPELCELFRVFYKQFGPTRIVFGTDSSFFPRGWVAEYAWEQLEAAHCAGIPDASLEMIFRDNALRLLRLRL